MSCSLAVAALHDEALQQELIRCRIPLSVSEARRIAKLLGRDPTITELTIWGIQGSEHCSYKSSRRFLKLFPTEGRHVILGPGEDSGIVAITDGPPGKRWGIVLSHESHNHPSQVVPFEGAATGIGGTVRDVACMGARVIGCMDSLRLGDLRTADSRTVAREVIRGIAGYGNPLGLPNLGGDTVFDASFNDACLVNAVAVGIVREDEIIHSAVPHDALSEGYDIILVGKPTDRSGFGGAAFASAGLSSDDREANAGAVQEPNPFLERHLLVSTYALFDWLASQGQLSRVSFKDLGAGGIVCSTVEQVAGRELGAMINLDLVHTALPNLPPEVLACAETQERFCWMCPATLTNHILRHYNEVWALPDIALGARASLIGRVMGDGIYRLMYKGDVVCEARSRDIVMGFPEQRAILPRKRLVTEPILSCDGRNVTLFHSSQAAFSMDFSRLVHALLSHANCASKGPILHKYDKSVIGNTLIEAGEADASVIAPLQNLQSYVQSGVPRLWDLPEVDKWVGVALAADGNNRYGRISPYSQGANAAVEAMCNVAAVGAVPRALTDCLNYGNPEIPEQLFDLAEGVSGIADAARGVCIDGEAVPVISGNVSLYNTVSDGSAIDPSAIVCCIGVMPDARRAVSMQLKTPGSSLFLLGDRKDECGGSAYYALLESLGLFPRDFLLGANVPQPDFSLVHRLMMTITTAIQEGLVLSCHDISDGGLFLTLFEMTLPQRGIGGNIGIDVSLDFCDAHLRSDTALFTQTPGFVLEVQSGSIDALRTFAAAKGIVLTKLGTTLPSPILRVSRSGQILLEEELPVLREKWEGGLRDQLECS